MSRNVERCFAIVRVEADVLTSTVVQNAITVKAIVWSQEDAEGEVSRLNALNAEKGCSYFWQASRAWLREAT